MLPHGIARFYPDLSQIAIRPRYRLFSIGFRSAWPVKGLIHLSAGNQTMDALCVKRIPWSSALMTLLWFGVVLIGSLVFVVTYAWDGGFASLEGVFMGVGLVAGALLVLAAGLVTVTMSYRLEHNRLMQVYEELRDALEGPTHQTPDSLTS
jgi:vacuolar-type H+-ATPase subunit I/STV1